MRRSATRPARDARIRLSQASSRTRCATMSCPARGERDAAVTLAASWSTSGERGRCPRRRSRQDFCRRRSCSRCFERSRSRRRLPSDLSRFRRHSAEQVLCVWSADQCGRNHFRQLAHRRRAVFCFFPIPGRSGWGASPATRRRRSQLALDPDRYPTDHARRPRAPRRRARPGGPFRRADLGPFSRAPKIKRIRARSSPSDPIWTTFSVVTAVGRST